MTGVVELYLRGLAHSHVGIGGYDIGGWGPAECAIAANYLAVPGARVWYDQNLSMVVFTAPDGGGCAVVMDRIGNPPVWWALADPDPKGVPEAWVAAARLIAEEVAR